MKSNSQISVIKWWFGVCLVHVWWVNGELGSTENADFLLAKAKRPKFYNKSTG